MKGSTRALIRQIDAAPELFQNLRNLVEITAEQKKLLDGAPVPEDVRNREALISEGLRIYRRLFRRLEAVSDPDIRALLTTRALTGLPWELMRLRDGTDALEGCAAWLDAHAEEV